MNGGHFKGLVMIKHVFNEVLVWDIPTETTRIKNLCEKCGAEESSLKCTPVKIPYDTKYLDKALKALAKAS
jgi:hypothetical protein